MESIPHFDDKYWIEELRRLKYPIKYEELDLAVLKSQGIFASDFTPSAVSRVYVDDFVEAALLKFEKDTTLTRSRCTRVAKLWKERRMVRPLLIFTNGESSFVTTVPGPGITGEVRVLALEENLYRTDREALNSLEYPSHIDREKIAETLRRKYDTEFLPYERVRQEFFDGYRKLYEKLVAACREVLKEQASAYAQRFLGRLMFLYFLQKKGWLRKNKKFVDTISSYKELNRIFYESLNKPGAEGIPYLNGSLFEREDYITEQVEDRLSDKMDGLFKEARAFFNQYNFTVDETASLEVEVSIDPALIGTVFENMLPEYERGSKGTFYTPRTESSFICRRALCNYLGLQDKISEDGKKFMDGLKLYLDGLKQRKSEKEVREFKERLLSIKVLDPAVGSGGFLLVMMQEILALLQEADSAVGWKTDAEEYKKRILHNLWGFDIEAEAVEIARLRLWLSLIIDQKEPEALPNLDMSLMVINDSLLMPNAQQSLDEEVKSLQMEFSELRKRYIDEHDPAAKKTLKSRMLQIGEEIKRRTGMDPNVIETYMQGKADLVIMNPPYVRQESIPEKLKNYYTARYGLDKKSDLYAYFLVRSLQLISENGIVSVISSDKWLETGYGVSVQKKLRENLVAVYGQRERTFSADINTVITVLKKLNADPKVHFVYLDSYSRDDIRQYIKLDKKELNPGKWFYLRPGAKFFIEKLLPKLTYKLGDFADIKFGIKTGANEFFYMKDVSHLYETDRLANPKKFEEWGVKAKTKKELEEQGLIYIENGNKDRFILEQRNVRKIIKSPKELTKYVESSKHLTSLIFYPSELGRFSREYISYGEDKNYHKVRSCTGRKRWYLLPDLKPANLVIIVNQMDRLFNPLIEPPVIVDKMFYAVYPKHVEINKLWIAINSTIFLILSELFGLRMGGGGGVLTNTVEGYENIPMFDIKSIADSFVQGFRLDRNVLTYNKEISLEDRRSLDRHILCDILKLTDTQLNELYELFIELVEDRLIKADRPLKSKKGQHIESGNFDKDSRQ
jgi:type I restriction-modification system DNA methylase subunit